MTDRLMQEILEVLEIFAFPPTYGIGDTPIKYLAPSEDAILRAQELYYKLSGAIRD